MKLYISILLVSLITGLTSSKVNAKMIEYLLGKDATMSIIYEFNADQIFDFILNDANLENSHDGCRVILMTIGQASLPVVEIIELEEANKWLTPKHIRYAKVKSFKAELKGALERLSAIPVDQKATQFHRSLMHGLSLLSPDAERNCFLWTDAIESSSITNMHTLYEKHPEKLMEAQEQEKVRKILCADTPLSPLANGAKITFITPGISEMSIQAIRFFSEWLKQAGSTVNVQSSLF